MVQRSYSGAKGGKFEVSIGSLDDPTVTVYAQYRPAELQIDQAVPWTKHENKGVEGELQLEFTGAEGRNTTLELFFDASENPNSSVETAISDLSALATPTVQDPADPKNPSAEQDRGILKRPHHCVLVFGRVFNQRYRCVIESLATKITMFSPEGRPIRATVSVKLKEASYVSTGSALSKGRRGG